MYFYQIAHQNLTKPNTLSPIGPTSSSFLNREPASHRINMVVLNMWQSTTLIITRLLAGKLWFHCGFNCRLHFASWKVIYKFSGSFLQMRLIVTGGKSIHVIRPDIVDTYRYWAPKYESRPTDRNSRYIWIPIFRFCQKLKLVFRSPQTLALPKFTTGSGNRSLLVFRNR